MQLAEYERPETLIRWFGQEAYCRALDYLVDGRIELNRYRGHEQPGSAA